jgi:hypothetical protein
MKVIYKYHNGNCLRIAKENLNSMLFLEALSEFNADSRIIHKVINDTDKHCFYIHLNLTKKQILSIVDYINSNTDNY